MQDAMIPHSCCELERGEQAERKGHRASESACSLTLELALL